MNFATFIVLVILAIAVVFALKYVGKHGLDDCGGNCGSCGGSCSNIKRGLELARKELEEEKRAKQL